MIKKAERGGALFGHAFRRRCIIRPPTVGEGLISPYMCVEGGGGVISSGRTTVWAGAWGSGVQLPLDVRRGGGIPALVGHRTREPPDRRPSVESIFTGSETTPLPSDERKKGVNT